MRKIPEAFLKPLTLLGNSLINIYYLETQKNTKTVRRKQFLSRS